MKLKTVRQLGYKIPTNIFEKREVYVQVEGGTAFVCSQMGLGGFSGTYEEILGDLHALLLYGKKQKYSIATAATSGCQKEAQKALKALGFSRTSRLVGRDRGGVLYFWWKPVLGRGSALPRTNKECFYIAPEDYSLVDMGYTPL